ncbi:probable WRKY transcription factor 75 [Cucurbita moschata]|uniref:Probable WRKY transcription factor 75 n=1 Tax=Cucurbita moschata TaxID=3662 RepID=A0A6J1EN76_CUCMO|nr:probable WRKY transcription factor 75 [Cucurbita moschata]
MENYQMFFPCSGGEGLSAYHHPDMSPDSGSDVFGSFHGGNLQGNGFLKMETAAVVEGDRNSGGDSYQIGGGKKKGEKKVRKPRYAFETKSQVDILDDGYRWRKYGQKAVKNNKFPRSYYRCTHQGCNVKKQVQRLTRDEGVVVTTYEGMHTHSIDKPTDNFEQILSRMQIYGTSF